MDIVDRLREQGADAFRRHYSLGMWRLCAEAADEIEQLRAQQKGNAMTDFQQYRRKQIAELRPYTPGEALTDVSISVEDAKAGSPKIGDMIARNPKNHNDQWLVAAAYFADNFEPVA
jgi:hypothetical protein